MFLKIEKLTFQRNVLLSIVPVHQSNGEKSREVQNRSQIWYDLQRFRNEFQSAAFSCRFPATWGGTSQTLYALVWECNMTPIENKSEMTTGDFMQYTIDTPIDL